MFDGDARRWRRDGFELIAQRGAGLGERLAAAFDDVALAGAARRHGHAPADAVAAARRDARAGEARTSTRCSAPRSTAATGASGSATRAPGAFAGVPMSCESTCARQRARLGELGLRVHEQPLLRDVDTIEDARAVASARRPHTRFARALAAICDDQRAAHVRRRAARRALAAARAAARAAAWTARPSRLPLERYLGPADATDEQLLDGLSGPGARRRLRTGAPPARARRLAACSRSGVDLSPVAVELAVGRRRPGDRRRHLRRAAGRRNLAQRAAARRQHRYRWLAGAAARPASERCWHPTGSCWSSSSRRARSTCSTQARLESDGVASAWFPWARVAAPAIEPIARAGGFRADRGLALCRTLVRAPAAR